MKPLPIKKRRFYLFGFAFLFFVFIPVLILYSTGYRLSGFRLIQTGGIFLSVPESGAVAIIDSSIVKETGFFLKNIYVKNLKPETHSIKITKDGFQEWYKELMVYPQTVTEAHSFLLPNNPVLVEIQQFIISTSTVGTTTPPKVSTTTVSNTEYKNVTALFSTTTPQNPKRKLIIKNTDGVLRVAWSGTEESMPYYFCSPTSCQKEINISLDSKIVSFSFFPGRDDLLVVKTSGGLFAVEIDNRSSQNIQTLAKKENIDFRIDDGVIYIKEGKKLFFISL